MVWPVVSRRQIFGNCRDAKRITTVEYLLVVGKQGVASSMKHLESLAMVEFQENIVLRESELST